MDPSARVVGLDAQGNMVFTVVKPVMGIFQVSSEQTGSVAQGGMGLQGLSENTLILPQAQGQVPLDQNQVEMHNMQHHIQPQMQMSAPVQAEEVPQNQELATNSSTNSQSSTQMPFAEVSSLLDPNMKGSKARKCPAVAIKKKQLLLNPKSCCVDSPGPVSFQESISSRTMKSSDACRLQRRCPCAPWQPTLGSAEARPARKPSWSHSAFSASRQAQLPLFPPLSPNSLKVTD